MAERTKQQRQAASAATSNTADDGAEGAAAPSPEAAAPTSGEQSSAKTATKTAAKATKSTTSRASAKKAPPKKAPAKPSKQARSADETERIRVALAARLGELREEYDLHIAEIAELQRDRLTDSAGDDQADTGSKTFEREQEISLANSILERTTQVERALERLAEGSYGWCERCGNQIPVERLAAFPSATLCVSCKQLEERR